MHDMQDDNTLYLVQTLSVYSETAAASILPVRRVSLIRWT